MEINTLKSNTGLALKAAFAAGEKIIEVYKKTINVDMKSDGSPLTEADRISHETIINYLKPAGFPVLSEEGKEISFEERKKWEYYWLVDPLDGTKEFIKRNGEFTVNIALMENNIPVSGIIYQPVKEIAYAGIAGDGLYRFSSGDTLELVPEKKIRSTQPDGRKRMRIIASRTHNSGETTKFIDDLRSEKEVELMSAGSALKFCLIADGRADIYPRFAPTMEWDTAAGHALLKAVGKNIYLYPGGTEMNYNKPKLVNDWFIAR
jgi:3'(2'), 5'-bisphosphate nucleotidase